MARAGADAVYPGRGVQSLLNPALESKEALQIESPAALTTIHSWSPLESQPKAGEESVLPET